MDLVELRRSRELVASGKVRQMRLDAGISQAELAEALGVTAGAVAHWETGRRMPLRNMAVQLVRTLESLTAADGSPEIVGLTLNDIDDRSDRFAAIVDSAMHTVLRETIEQNWGTEVAKDDLSDLEDRWERFVPVLVDELGTIWFEAAEAVRQQTKDVVESVTADAADILTGLEAGRSGIRNQKAEQYLAEASNRLRHVPDLTWRDARSQLVDGMREGLSVPNLATRVQDSLGPLGTESRATTIARTEVIGATNAGQQMMIDGTTLPYTKRWVATLDGRTRDSHMAINGTTIPKGERYNLFGGSLMYPGDPTGPPEEVINCRCTEVYELADEETLRRDYFQDPGGEVQLEGQEANDHLSQVVNRSLTDEENRALQYYGGRRYRELNAAMREGTELSAEQAEVVRRLQSAANSFRTDKPIVVYRGMTDATGRFPENAVGMEFRDRAFASTTTDRGIGGSFIRGPGQRILVEARVPAGTPTVPVEWVNQYGKRQLLLTEAEVILMPKTTMRVIADDIVEVDRRETRKLVVEVVP